MKKRRKLLVLLLTLVMMFSMGATMATADDAAAGVPAGVVVTYDAGGDYEPIVGLRACPNAMWVGTERQDISPCISYQIFMVFRCYECCWGAEWWHLQSTRIINHNWVFVTTINVGLQLIRVYECSNCGDRRFN